MPRFFENSIDDDSSRASTPDEMTPSLPKRSPYPVRQELCVSCIAKAAAAINQNNVGEKSASSSGADNVSKIQDLGNKCTKRIS